MKNIPYYPGKVSVAQIQGYLPIGGNLPPGNVPHKFINSVIQTAHNVFTKNRQVFLPAKKLRLFSARDSEDQTPEFDAMGSGSFSVKNIPHK